MKTKTKAAILATTLLLTGTGCTQRGNGPFKFNVEDRVHLPLVDGRLGVVTSRTDYRPGGGRVIYLVRYNDFHKIDDNNFGEGELTPCLPEDIHDSDGKLLSEQDVRHFKNSPFNTAK